MKKSILTVSLLVLMATFSNAVAQQDGKQQQKKELRQELSPEQIAQKKTERMTKQLKLDEAQQKKVYDINLKHAQEQVAMKAERKALKERHLAAKKSYSENVDRTLTDEQKVKLAEIKAKKVEKSVKHKHPVPPPPPVNN